MSRLVRNSAIAGAGAMAAWGAAAWWRRSEVSPIRKRLAGHPKVVILGCGFGGMNAAAELARLIPNADAASIRLIDGRGNLLFTPMLTEVAAGEVDARHVVASPKHISERICFERAHVDDIDLKTRHVSLTLGSAESHVPEREESLEADHLVICLGATADYHGVPGLKEHSLPIRTVDEAVAIRNRALHLVERAAAEANTQTRREILTFVVAGGGYTGVETAAALNGLVREGARRSGIAAGTPRVMVVEPGDRLLAETTPELAAFAQRKLGDSGVEVRLKTKVTGAGADSVELEGIGTLPSHLLVWAGGVKPNPLVQKLDCRKGKHGGIAVDETCAVPGCPGVWAIGDCAEIPNGEHGSYAPTAQNASREGTHVARNIVNALSGQPPAPFLYEPVGELALTGRHSGVARIYGVQFAGFPAWMLWRSVYLLKMPQRSQRFRIAFDWLLDLAFGRNMADVS